MAGELILAIEDDAVVRRLLTVLLEDAGFEVILAEAGDVGLDTARERRPAVVLVDIGLPNKHGNEVLEEIKADPEIGDTPVIVVSAWGESIASRSRELGAYDVLMKPFSDETLIRAVTSALAGIEPAASPDAAPAPPPYVPPPSAGPPAS